MRVAIFDSGVGGLSIYQHVKAKLPDCDYVVVGDNLAYPYGDKSEEVLNTRVMAVMARIQAQFQPDLAVVACNTASTVVLPLLRAKYSMPIVGVVPAIKPASRLSKTRHIGLLATPGTISRGYTEQLIKEFAADCKITKAGSVKLVEIAEAKLYGSGVDTITLEAELMPFLMAEDCDILVLACTHYPLLNKEIKDLIKVYNRTIKLIDSGSGIANRVASLLARQVPNRHGPGSSIAVFTKEIANESTFISNLSALGLQYQGLLKT